MVNKTKVNSQTKKTAPIKKEPTAGKLKKNHRKVLRQALLFILILSVSLIPGRYVYDHVRFQQNKTNIKELAESIINTSNNTTTPLEIKQEGGVCYINTNLYHKDIMKNCEYTLRLALTEKYTGKDFYEIALPSLSSIMGKVQNVDNIENNSHLLVDYTKAIKDQKIVNPSSLVFYSSTTKNSSTATTCTITIRYDGSSQLKQQANTEDTRYLGVVLLCSGKAIFPPYHTVNR